MGHCDLRLWDIVTYVYELLSHVRTLSIGYAHRHQRQVFTKLTEIEFSMVVLLVFPLKISQPNPR